MGAADFSQLKELTMGMAFALPRMLAIFLVLPLFNRQLIPGILRMGVACALCIMLAPLLAPKAAHLQLGLGVLGIMVKEAMIGFIFGLFAAIPFWGLEAVGFIIDNQRGASIASTVNPLTGHDSSPLGMLFNQAFIVFFLVSGGFVLLLSAIYSSYLIWPVFDWFPNLRMDAAPWLLDLLDRLVKLAIVLAGPVLIAMFLAEMGLALISRFTPQLQVFFLAMPIKSALAMLILGLYAGTLFEYARAELAGYGELATHIDRLLGWGGVRER